MAKKMIMLLMMMMMLCWKMRLRSRCSLYCCYLLLMKRWRQKMCYLIEEGAVEVDVVLVVRVDEDDVKWLVAGLQLNRLQQTKLWSWWIRCWMW